MPTQQTKSSDDIINIGDNAASRLKSFIDRIERTQQEIDNFTEDKKEIYAEAKAIGLDVAIIRKAVTRRKKDRDTVLNDDALLMTYEKAIGETVLESMLE